VSAARAGFRVLLEDVMPANLHHAREVLRGELESQRLGEDSGSSGTERESHAAGAEARVNSAATTARLKSCPDTEQLPSGAEARVDIVGFTRGLKPPPSSAPASLSGSSFSAGYLAAEGMQTIEDTHPQGLKPSVLIAHQAARLKPCPFKTEGLTVQEALPIAFVSSIEEAVREADLVIDCVPDELESKLEILWLLDRMAPPRTVLATPTTRLSIADLANCTYRPAKCIAIAAEASALTGKAEGEADGAEILLRTTSKTAAETVALAGDFWRRLGFTPRFERDAAE
jgi:3-hydroxybutyryl-CoA dehydrogenase